MHHKYLKFILLLMIGFGFQNLIAQDTIRLKESIAINKNATYSLQAGTVLVLSPNVRIQIEGNIQLEGTSILPIQVISEFADQPGEGFIIKSNNHAASANISYVNFVGLIQPLRFDPYWSRKEVNIENIKISKSTFFEPIIFISSPIIDINKNLSKINISNSEFFNNNSGIIIESAGNVKYELNVNNLSFYENSIKGIDKTLGVLHIELAKPFYNKNFKIGSLAFNRNSSGNDGIGVSVAGNQDSIAIDNIYSLTNERPIYDNQKDLRLPFVKTTLSDLANWNKETNWIKSIQHKTDTITFDAIKNLNITQLLDSAGNLVPFTLKQFNGKTLAYYNETISFKTIPTKAIVDNNYSVVLPPPVISSDSTRTKYLVKQQPGLWISSSAYYFPYVKFIPTFEVTAWGGLATYFGDVKTRWGLPGALDWSGGFGLQYNYSKKISFSTSFNNFSVSMGNASAAWYLGRSAPVVYSDKNKGLIYQQNTFEFNFITEIKSIDFNVLWNLKPLNTYESTKSDKVTYTPILGLGFTVFKFDPYRNLYYSHSADSNVKVSLRELGTEGQNYNGKGTYGQYSAGLNGILQFRIGYKRFHVKGDIKYVFTFTDYLDDYGKGILYGGDYNKWVETNNGRLDQPIQRFDKTVSARGYFPEYNLTSKRTTDILTDAYMQFHIGVGYDIGTLKKRK